MRLLTFSYKGKTREGILLAQSRRSVRASTDTVSSSCCGPGLGGTEVVRRRRARGGRVDSCGDSWGCCGNRQVRGSARRHRSRNPGQEGGAAPRRVRTGCEHLPSPLQPGGHPSCDAPGRAGTGGPVLSRLAHPHKPSGPSSRTPTAPTGLGAASPPPAAFPPLPRPCLPAAPGSPVRAPAPHRPLRRPPPSSPDTPGFRPTVRGDQAGPNSPAQQSRLLPADTAPQPTASSPDTRAPCVARTRVSPRAAPGRLGTQAPCRRPGPRRLQGPSCRGASRPLPLAGERARGLGTVAGLPERPARPRGAGLPTSGGEAGGDRFLTSADPPRCTLQGGDLPTRPPAHTPLD